MNLMNTAIISFDLETSGAYPVGSEIVEFGAVKYQQGKEVDSLQLLIKPQSLLTDANMAIHGITNEMLASAPRIESVIQRVHDFMEDAILLAHHAPFDMGFLAHDFEKAGLNYPKGVVLCTSLLARKLIQESPNHKLQTLVKFLKLDGGQAHRGLDDARACMQVGLTCFKRLAQNLHLENFELLKSEDLVKAQGKSLLWKNFSLKSVDTKVLTAVAALEKKKNLELEYRGGSRVGLRQITPLGIVRNPDGDFLQAICHLDHASKRFYFEKIESLRVVESHSAS